MPVEIFVDESARRGDYMLAVVSVNLRDLTAKRAALRRMLLPGERRMHFSKETAARRRELIGQIARQQFSVAIFTCRAKKDVARALLIEALVGDVGDRVNRLVFESRSHDDIHDRRTLLDLRRSGQFPADAAYEHLLPYEEPLLWVADATAWAWGAGGDWRRRVEPIVVKTVRIGP